MDTARAQPERFPLIGCVSTNQVRKELGLWGSVCSILADRLDRKVSFWLHVDTLVRHYNVPAIIEDFGLKGLVEVTTPPVDDSWLAQIYRQCDVTFLPSSGEGFGYPLFESLACGTPVIHGDYAAGASLMAAFGLGSLLVTPEAYRVEGIYNSMRPVYDPYAFADAIIFSLDSKQKLAYNLQVEHLSWSKLGHTWKRWFKEGIGA